MGAIIISHWFIVIAFGLLYAVPVIKILGRTGHSRWWAIAFFIPLLNIIPLWVFAYGPWPRIDRSK